MAQKHFEKSLTRLEKIVEKLEAGKIPLEESLKLFEEGVGLVRNCSLKIDEISKKVKILVRSQEKEFIEKDFNLSEGNPSLAGDDNEGQKRELTKKPKGKKKQQESLF